MFSVTLFMGTKKKKKEWLRLVRIQFILKPEFWDRLENKGKDV